MNHKPTQKETVRTLVKSILNRLENAKSITCNPTDREKLRDEVYALIGPFVLTDQDLHEKTLEKIGASAEELTGAELTESAQYRTAKSLVRKSFGDDQLNGFFFQKTLKHLAQDVSKYLMESSLIEDVFDTDEKLEQLIVDVIKNFNPERLS